MNFDIDFSITVRAITFLAVFARIGSFIFAFPLFKMTGIPKLYKIMFVLMLSVVLLPVVPKDWISKEFIQNMNYYSLTVMLASEILLGGCIALFVLLIAEVFTFAGFLVDRSIGFAMARVVDPSSNINSTLMSSIYMQIFALMFVIVNGHHQVIRLAALSFKTLGAGEFVFTGDIAINILHLSGRIFQMGLQIAFPIFAVILLINIGMGLMARAAQGFPVLMLSFPLRLGVGLIILISTMPVVIILARESNLQLLDWVEYLIAG